MGKKEYLAKKRERAIEIAMSGKEDKQFGRYVPVIIIPVTEHSKQNDIDVSVNNFSASFKAKEPVALPEKIIEFLEEECYGFIYHESEIEGKSPTPEKEPHYIAKEIRPTEEEKQKALEALADKE